MLAAKDDAQPLQLSTKFISEQRVVCVRLFAPVLEYRAFAGAAIEKMLGVLLADGQAAAAAPFCILHDHFDWKHQVDLEICVPVRRRARLPQALHSRTMPGTTVLFTVLEPNAYDALTQAEEALAALETCVIESDRLFAGDVREVYPWGQTRVMEMQLPVT